MKITSDLVKRLRSERLWSQDQLADACGLNLRTIQRLESTGNASLESVRALAAVFEISPDELIVGATIGDATPFEVVKTCFANYANYTGKANRYEFWWFLVFVILVAAVATLVNQKLGMIFQVVMLLPLLAVGARRLNDVGQSPWWQMMYLAPFGFVVVWYLCSMQSQATDD